VSRKLLQAVSLDDNKTHDIGFTVRSVLYGGVNVMSSIIVV
jgi:hypothetical protein